jgi:lipopolysaccharide exporter
LPDRPNGTHVDTPPHDGELKRTAVGGAGWEGLSLFAGKLLLLISTIALARLLAPSKFGVVALTLVFIQYADTVADLGVAEALIYLPPSRRTNDAAFALSVAWSAILVITGVVAAPWVGRFFHEPDIVPMFRVLSVSLFLRGTAEVPEALLFKQLRWRRRLWAVLGRGFGQGLVSVLLATMGFGAWSIIIGYIIGDILWCLISWRVVDYRPGLGSWRLSRQDARALLAFGLPAAGTSLILVLLFNVDYLIVGRRLGPEALAFYTIGFRIPELVIIKVFYMLSRVAFTLYSRVRDDATRLRRGYLTGLRIQAAYGMLTGVGLAMVAPMAVRIVFGPKWAPAVVPLEALSLYAAFRSLDAIDVYKGIGRPGLAVQMSLIRLAFVVPVLYVAAGHSISVVSWAQAVLSLAMALMMQAIASRVLGLRLRELAGALVPGMALGLGVAMGAGTVRLLLSWPPPAELAAATLAGGTGALALLWLVDRQFIEEIRTLLARRRADSKPTVTPAAVTG